MVVGNNTLGADMAVFGYDNTYASIHPVFGGQNPEVSRSSVPYEKGAQLLSYVQSIIGAESMMNFTAYYIQTNSGKAINSFDMEMTFSNFIERNIQDSD
jgi:leukotriene-A4 hydrolase